MRLIDAKYGAMIPGRSIKSGERRKENERKTCVY